MLFFFFQAEDGIRYVAVTGVQTCALPIWIRPPVRPVGLADVSPGVPPRGPGRRGAVRQRGEQPARLAGRLQIGRASGRGRGEISGGGGSLKKKKKREERSEDTAERREDKS